MPKKHYMILALILFISLTPGMLIFSLGILTILLQLFCILGLLVLPPVMLLAYADLLPSGLLRHFQR